MNPLGAKFYRSDLVCEHRQICTYVQLSVISVLMKEYKVACIDRSGFMTLATGDMKRTKRSGPRTEPWGTPVHIVVQDEDDESILTKEVRLVR